MLMLALMSHCPSNLACGLSLKTLKIVFSTTLVRFIKIGFNLFCFLKNKHLIPPTNIKNN